MTRPLRVEYPGAYYHVISRGNGGEKIFRSIRDREKFIEYLEKTVERFSIIIHTYCLMANHYHLLIETLQPNLSVAVQWLNVSYAGYFNRKAGVVRANQSSPCRGVCDSACILSLRAQRAKAR